MIGTRSNITHLIGLNLQYSKTVSVLNGYKVSKFIRKLRRGFLHSWRKGHFTEDGFVIDLVEVYPHKGEREDSFAAISFIKSKLFGRSMSGPGTARRPKYSW